MSGPFGAIAAGVIIFMFAAQFVAGAAALVAWGTGIGMRVAVVLVLVGLSATAYAVLKRKATALAR